MGLEGGGRKLLVAIVGEEERWEERGKTEYSEPRMQREMGKSPGAPCIPTFLDRERAIHAFCMRIGI